MFTKTTKQVVAPQVSAPVDVKKIMPNSSAVSRADSGSRPGRRRGKKGPQRSKPSPQLAVARHAHLTSDSKQEEGDGVVLSSPSLSLMAGLVNPLQEYTFRMVNSGSITASSGIWAGAPKFDPTTQAEWSSFDSLFNEYKVVWARITFLPFTISPLSSGGNGATGPFVICAANLGAFGTNPTSVANCMEPSNAKVINLSPGAPHSQYVHYTAVTDLEFQVIGSAGTPYAGAYGQFSIYGSDVGMTTSIISYVLELGVTLRARS